MRRNGRRLSRASARRTRRLSSVALSLLMGGAPATALAELSVVSISPAPNTTANRTTAIVVTFDGPVDRTTVNDDTFRIFGLWSGKAEGTRTFSNDDQTLTFTPDAAFSAGESVSINLSNALAAAGGDNLRPEGYASHFKVAVAPSPGPLILVDGMSNRTDDIQTRIYGASAADVNNDGFCDLTTVNEVSADVRVFLNGADGTGTFEDVFLEPQGIGVEASPNGSADFDNDGNTDLCISASISQSVWILLGAGDGTFSSIEEIVVGGNPHGIAPVDVDGDADMDVVVANATSDNLSLMINDGSGSFGAPTSFDGGVEREYGLASADIDRDGIVDLVVGGFIGEEVRALFGNGDGTFTPAAAAYPSGGLTWVVQMDDVDGDGELDAAVANSTTGNVAVLLGHGDGTFDAPAIIDIGAHTPAVDLGDLDGDGDPDLVASSFGGGFWRFFTNDGTGGFDFWMDVDAPSNPSCAVLFDSDNDEDLDVALTDEIADVILVYRNGALVTVDPSVASPPGRAGLWNVPEPASRATTIGFELPVRGSVTLELFDVGGRRVLVRELGAYGPGSQRIRLDLDGEAALGGGVYVYRVSSGEWSATDRLVVAR